jgi:glycerol-3-phosphate dehydrogenase (NAD(P)+)
VVLLALPAQQTEAFVKSHLADLPDAALVLCAKGIALDGMKLQSDLIPDGRELAILTGPGFADEIAAGLPTALTLASHSSSLKTLQKMLSRPALRLYRSDDIVGAQVGGALKNVVAIAAGIAIGSGLGQSARAAIVTRGFAEMRRLALAMGAKDTTLSGLSGFGDLMLTSASEKSRNFAFGQALGQGRADPGQTTEGIATAKATVSLAKLHRVDMPVASGVAQVLEGLDIVDVMGGLLSRPLRAE